MPAALTRLARRLSTHLVPAARELFDPEDLPFRGSLGVLSLAACAFTVWVAVTPPRAEAAILDVRQVSALVMDLPRIALPPPVVEPLRPPPLVGEPHRAPARAPRSAAPAAPSAGGPEGGRRGPRLFEVIRTDGPSALEVLDADSAVARDLDDALRKVRGHEVARLDGGFGGRTDRADGDVGLDLGRLDAGVSVGVPKGEVPTVRAKVEAEAATLDGDVADADAAVIARIVRAHQGRIATCVEQSLKRDPRMSGRVEAGWSITRGRVSAARVVADTTGDAELGACVVRAVRGFRFPAELDAEVASFPWAVAGG